MYKCSTDLAEDLRVTKDHDTIIGPRQCNVQPPWVVEETDALMLVAAHAAQDNIVLLATLERIHAGHFDLLVQILLERAIELHIVDDVGSLPFIWRDDPDLARDDTRLEELRHDFLHVRRFRSVCAC